MLVSAADLLSVCHLLYVVMWISDAAGALCTVGLINFFAICCSGWSVGSRGSAAGG